MIVVVFDLSEKVDDFIEHKAPFSKVVFQYYINFLPFFANQFSPLFTFISVIFFTSRMAQQTEVVAILSSGVSFKRFLRPYLVGASILALLSFILTGYIIPKANKVRLAFEEAYINDPFRYDGRHIHRQISPGVYIYLESYNTLDQLGYKFSIEKFENGSLQRKVMCDFIRWDSIKHTWNLNHYSERTIKKNREIFKQGFNKDTTLAFSPSDFAKRINTTETMTNGQLTDFIDLEKQRGSERINYYLIEKYKRYSAPFATYILTIIGVAMASRKVRGGIGLQLGAGLTLSFTYILFQQIFNTFATNGDFHPMLATWIPNLLFLAIGLFLLNKAPK